MAEPPGGCFVLCVEFVSPVGDGGLLTSPVWATCCTSRRGHDTHLVSSSEDLVLPQPSWPLMVLNVQ